MKPKWKQSLNTSRNARAVLPKLVDKYFQAGRKAAGATGSAKALHQFRIATKRFRYSLELFRPVYGASLERRLKALRELQQSLGQINDYRTILKFVPNDEALQAKLQNAIKRKSKEFRARWKVFDLGPQLKNWKAYLAGAPSRSSVP
jgi:CHAD domain-containing protein